MKKKMMMTLAAAATVAVVAVAADMASQPWVNMRIAQQETNTQEVVDSKIDGLVTTGGVSAAWVAAKISDLENRMRQEMQSSYIVLADTNDVHSVNKAMTIQSAAALPLATYIFSLYGNL